MVERATIVKHPERVVAYVNLGVAALALAAFVSMVVVQSCAMQVIANDSHADRLIMFDRIDKMEAEVDRLARDVETLGENVDATHTALNELDDSAAEAINELRDAVMRIDKEAR